MLPREFETWDELPPAMWPTPKGSAGNYGRPRDNDRGDLQAAVLWQTPKAEDAIHPGRTAPHKTGQTLHPAEQVNRKQQITGQLNPTWVEWLMGYPDGWTDYEDSETPSSPKSPNTSAASSSPPTSE